MQGNPNNLFIFVAELFIDHIKTFMKKILLALFALLAMVSCSDTEDIDTEAQEKTEQLRKEYNAKLQGTWHREVVNNENRFFERISFKEDHTFKLLRIWQKPQGTGEDIEWEDVEEENVTGEFTGTWMLKWQRLNSKEGENVLVLQHKTGNGILQFIDIINDELIVGAVYLATDGIAVYERGGGNPSF